MYDVLAVLKGALRAVHGEEKVRTELSGYYVALEWIAVYAGMMIVLPEPEWEPFGLTSAREWARRLREGAMKVDLRTIKKARPRQPTRNETMPIRDESPLLSTARLLDAGARNRSRKR